MTPFRKVISSIGDNMLTECKNTGSLHNDIYIGPTRPVNCLNLILLLIGPVGPASHESEREFDVSAFKKQ